jgi:pyruvate-ferredoxin/flavodoxin oxidoreductase
MINGNEQQKKAVESGHWPLYRYNPDLAAQGKNPLQLDSKEPTMPLADYVYNENRYKMLQRSHPETSQELIEQAQKVVSERFRMLKLLAS